MKFIMKPSAEIPSQSLCLESEPASTLDPQSLWRGIKCITNYSRNDALCTIELSLPDVFSNYDTHFARCLPTAISFFPVRMNRKILTAQTNPLRHHIFT